MFGLGPTELIVILVVALLVLGPQRLPEMASGMGKVIRDFRKATRDLSDQVEVDESIRQPIMELKAALRDEPPPWTPPTKSVPKPIPGPVVESTTAKPAEDCLAPAAPAPATETPTIPDETAKS
jgi:sec-independent protein translocase protein TatB